MTIINQKSISGITSITFASAGDDLLTFHSNNGTERFRIDNSGNTKITAGIVTTLTVTGATTLNGNLDLQDNDKILIGTGDDLEIYHDGSHSYIDDSGTGDLRIRSNNVRFDKYTGETIAQFIGDGRVELYYDNTKRFETTTTGVKTLGDLSIRNSSNTQHILYDESESALEFIDNVKASFGEGNDLQIYHDSSNSWITDNGAGSLKIRSTAGSVQILGTTSNDNMAVFTVDGASELYYDNSKKFETKSDGIDVTGEVQCDSVDVDGGHINLESGYSLQWGDSHERIEQSDSKLEFFTNNSEQMTLSGSNLGLGTNSNLNGLLTLHKDDDQLFLKQTDGDSGFLLGSNNTNGNLNLKRRSAGSNTTIATFRAAGGLTFNGDTAQANALDDYEEGTWTPAFENGGNCTYTHQAGKYTKIGNLVCATVHIQINSVGTASGTLNVTGFPYATTNSPNNVYGVSSSIHGTGWSTARTSLNVLMVPNTTKTLSIYYNMAGNSSSWGVATHADIGSGNLLFTMTYLTN